MRDFFIYVCVFVYMRQRGRSPQSTEPKIGVRCLGSDVTGSFEKHDVFAGNQTLVL